MADSDWNPDTAGRSLAEILREAGIERADRASRRRSWDDPSETAIRQRRAEAAAERSNAGGFGRRKSDFADRVDASAAGAPAVERRQSRRAVPEPSTAAIPGLRPDRKPGVPHPSGPLPSGPIPSGPFPSGAHPSAPVPPLRDGRGSDEGRRSDERRRTDERRRSDELPKEGRGRERRAPERAAEKVPPARERVAPRTSGRTRAVDDHPSTGPIPVVRPEDVDQDLDATPKESALAWLRFAGELVIALAAGVGVYFAATLLWEQLPHLAVFLAPLAVAGLVFGVSMWRQRQGREPIGPRLLALLVFAGTLLTIAPAAGLLAAAGT
jgi:hypothetical protein